MAKIQNPILRGFCPDPSIIRNGEDYYIATSTFEWWPGVRIHHSRDLVNWEQIPSPLCRKSQIDLTGVPNSGGMWAPCLSYDGEWYYLVYTKVTTKKGRFYNTHNYVIRTRDIYGEWSDPVYLNSVGFDPSLFHDNDGRKYLINMVNGFKGVLVQEYDAECGELVGEQHKVYEGSGIGCTEGPHMYHIGDYYYIICAEGGTGYDHCVTMARSKSIWGPFETAPENPILSADANNESCENEHSAADDMLQRAKDSGVRCCSLQKCGHADIVEGTDGTWYMVYLCSRASADHNSLLGRETAIQKMIWRDGWLQTEKGDGKPVSEWEIEDIAEREVDNGIDNDIGNGLYSEIVEGHRVTTFLDDFGGDNYCGDTASLDNNRLSVVYDSPRNSYEGFCDLINRQGKRFLRMRGQESLNSWFNVSLLAVRQMEMNMEAETVLDFMPECEEQLAGIAYVYDSMNFFIFGKTLNSSGQQQLVILQSEMGEITDLIEPIMLSDEDAGSRIRLIIRNNEDFEVSFAYSICREAGEAQDNDNNVMQVKADDFWLEQGEDDISAMHEMANCATNKLENCTTHKLENCTTHKLDEVNDVKLAQAASSRILTDEHCRGFTGAQVGMYVHDMALMRKCADFGGFKVRFWE